MFWADPSLSSPIANTHLWHNPSSISSHTFPAITLPPLCLTDGVDHGLFCPFYMFPDKVQSGLVCVISGSSLVNVQNHCVLFVYMYMMYMKASLDYTPIPSRLERLGLSSTKLVLHGPSVCLVLLSSFPFKNVPTSWFRHSLFCSLRLMMASFTCIESSLDHILWVPMSSYKMLIQSLESNPNLFIGLICHEIMREQAAKLSITCQSTFEPLKIKGSWMKMAFDSFC